MKRISIILSCLIFYLVGYSQQGPELNSLEQLEQQVETQGEAIKQLQKLKVTGYVQPQFQYLGKDASISYLKANENKEKSFNRIGIRRGRIKFTYEEGIASGMFQLDMTEKGVGIKDAYLNVRDPWIGTNALRVGVFDRPFGYEIRYSSSRRETPERSTIFQTFFPEERDLGAMLVLQAAEHSPWNFLKFEAGLFAGNGIKQETDNRKDFIGHASTVRDLNDNAAFGLGLSYYNGGVYQGTENIYTMQEKAFVLNSNISNIGQFAKREYFGVDGQLYIKSSMGNTQLRGEYLWGTQPGNKLSSKSPNASSLPTTDTYIRNFSGGYLMFVYDVMTSPFSAVLKYDWYDPNTKVAKNEIGQNGTDRGDITYNTISLGLLWRVTNNVRLQAYYEFVNNEISDNLVSHQENLEDNVFTLRLQYRF